jgi:LEA14-like dessication related protein
MRKKLLLGIVVLAIVAALLGSLVYAVGRSRTPKLESATLSWGEITEQTTTVNASLIIDNRLPLGIGSDSIGIMIPLRFYDVEAARFDLSGVNLPAGESALAAHATLQVANLPQWWDDFVENGETLVINIQPSLKVHVLGASLSAGIPDVQTDVEIPITKYLGSTESITMGFDDAPPWEIALNPGDHFAVSAPTPEYPVLTLESWALQWGNVTEETTQVLGTLVLRNELLVPMPIQGIELGLDLNEIRVVEDLDIIPTQSELPPGDNVSLELNASVANSKLIQWWASHLRGGEQTTATARVGVNIVLPVASGLGLTDPLPLPLVPIPALECSLQTDILGIANYKIAQELGAQLPEEPKAVDVEWSLHEAQLADAETQSGAPIVSIESIEVSPSSSSIAVGKAHQFIATATYDDGGTANVTSTVSWESSNSLLATVSSGGLVSGLFPGTVTITAILDGVTNSATLTITF